MYLFCMEMAKNNTSSHLTILKFRIRAIVTKIKLWNFHFVNPKTELNWTRNSKRALIIPKYALIFCFNFDLQYGEPQGAIAICQWNFLVGSIYLRIFLLLFGRSTRPITVRMSSMLRCFWCILQTQLPIRTFHRACMDHFETS